MKSEGIKNITISVLWGLLCGSVTIMIGGMAWFLINEREEIQESIKSISEESSMANVIASTAALKDIEQDKNFEKVDQKLDWLIDSQIQVFKHIGAKPLPPPKMDTPAPTDTLSTTQ